MRPPPSAHPERRQRTLGFAVAGAGIVGLAVGAVAGAVTLSKKSTVDDNCRGGLCNAEGKAAADDGKHFGTVSTIAFAAGAGTLVAGSLIVVAAPNKNRFDEAPHVGGYVGPTAVGFHARGAW